MNTKNKNQDLNQKKFKRWEDLLKQDWKPRFCKERAIDVIPQDFFYFVEENYKNKIKEQIVDGENKATNVTPPKKFIIFKEF